jgi:hypothetical protein
MTADDEHSDLLRVWLPLSDALTELPQRLEWTDDTVHQELVEKAERARALGSHLQGALELSQVGRYSSALALMRTCLEQVLVDWLLFQGRTVVQRVRDVSDETWLQWQREREAGAEWTKGIVDWTRSKERRQGSANVRIVREGLYADRPETGRSGTLSIYYFLLNEYQPTLRPTGNLADDGLVDLDQLKKFARENAAIWQVYLTWSALLENLSENELVDEPDRGRLGVHYAFLSGFAHPVANQTLIVDRSGTSGPGGRFDHYSSELVLLYAIRLAELELEHYLWPMTERLEVAVTGLDAMEGAISEAHAATRYFWFLGYDPHPYDVWKTSNAQVFRTLGANLRPVVDDAPTKVDQASYARDPLTRLIKMHSSAREMMGGLRYSSPWHRPDATFR